MKLDPATIAENAIGLFLEALEREDVQLRDQWNESGREAVERARLAAVSEVVQGVEADLPGDGVAEQEPPVAWEIRRRDGTVIARWLLPPEVELHLTSDWRPPVGPWQLYRGATLLREYEGEPWRP